MYIHSDWILAGNIPNVSGHEQQSAAGTYDYLGMNGYKWAWKISKGIEQLFSIQ